MNKYNYELEDFPEEYKEYFKPIYTSVLCPTCKNRINVSVGNLFSDYSCNRYNCHFSLHHLICDSKHMYEIYFAGPKARWVYSLNTKMLIYKSRQSKREITFNDFDLSLLDYDNIVRKIETLIFYE